MFTSYLDLEKPKELTRHAAIICLFIILSIFITYPLIFNIGSVTSGVGDELVLSYIQNYVIYGIIHHPLTLFNAPNYFPYLNTLAYSDSLITSSLLLALPAWFFHQPIAIYNLTLLFSLSSLGWSTFFLIKYLTRDWLVSLLGGTLIIFSPVILDKYVHLQVLFIFLVPLSFYFLIKFIDSKKEMYFYVFLLCFILQTLNSFLPGYFIVFGSILIVLIAYFKKELFISDLVTKKFILSGIFAVLILLPFIIPYYQVSREFGYTRDIRDTIHFAVQPEDLWYTSQFSNLSPFLSQFWRTSTYPSSISFKNGFPGIAIFFLTVLTIYHLIKRKKLDYQLLSVSSIGLLGLILSLGPFLHINRQTIHHPFPIPLPYLFFYYLIPGFNGMRNSARWEVLFILGTIIAGSMVLHILTRSWSSKKRYILVLSLAVITLVEFKPSINFVSIGKVSDFPKEYLYLQNQTNVRMVEMPIYNWNAEPYAKIEYLRQYYALSNLDVRRVNGVSGFSPPPWQEFVSSLLISFPSEKSLKELKSLGINTIIIHPQEYDQMVRDRYQVDKKFLPSSTKIISSMDSSKLLIKLRSYSTGVIYHLN